ncbi:hypothetical protein AB6A40_008123 [Gnathostoma spinigerum]|uniref:Nitrilase and fragile histidine triad fusion protein NitFhit n=1 Tax=Gnathostoma spinigerum TaxID=75299 RepID=A0ABD6ETB6_9BILA
MSSSGGSSTRRALIAVAQLTSKNDLKQNFDIANSMIRRAADRGAKMIFLPECFDYIGRNKIENISMAMSENGDFIGSFRNAAIENNIWISLGGFHQKEENQTCFPFNTHLILDNEGLTRGIYHKLHLFDLDIPDKVRLMESEFSTSGKQLCRPVNTPIGKVALSICYDIRFAELALWNRYQGAQVLTYPASFTVNTGLAHWESLLRARAIETQCYVVAAAQTGRHNEKRSSYGHSMVVDPWGAIISQCSETVDVCFAEISLDYLDEVRHLQPVFEHRRPDLYSLIANEKFFDGSDQLFGENVISKDVIFYYSAFSFAFVNRSPVLPGHVLVCPKREVHRLTDLTDRETADLFIVSKKVQEMLEKKYGTNSSSVCVQDGPEAGQTVKVIFF